MTEITLKLSGREAQQILDEATIDANNIRMGAIAYTDDMLANMEQILSTAINESGEHYRNYLASVQSCYDIVSKNRSELNPQSSAAQSVDSDSYMEDTSLDDFEDEE